MPLPLQNIDMITRLQEILHRREPELFGLLRLLVLIQSGTENKAGVDRVGRSIREFLDPLPLQTRVVARQKVGDHLVFSTPAASRGGYILITGHMDTVFPEDTTFDWYKEDTDNVYGPGVIDMKGGLVVTMAAVSVLAELGLLADMPLVLLFNSDEETGSLTSSSLIEELAARACCGLVTECGGLDGAVVTGRRGKAGFRLQVQGRAGHAAFAGSQKASAVLELCRQVIRLEELNDPDRGIVVNVGVVKGGIGPNTVAEHACALIDTRFCQSEDGTRLRRRMEDICENTWIPGTSNSLQLTNRRPVMEQTAANLNLYGIIQGQAEKLGITICREVRQGVSDASNIAGLGVPVVDGLGPIGEFDHSDREYMRKDSLVERSCLLAASILEINRQRSAL
jgi:glutamate carboxypeptidase